MATNSLSLEDGQKLIAAELLKSLLNVEPSDGDVNSTLFFFLYVCALQLNWSIWLQELELAFAVFIWYLDKKLQDRIPGMSESSRKSFVTGVVEQMASLVSQMKNAKTLDDALELIKAAVIVAWSNVVNGSISVEEATVVKHNNTNNFLQIFYYCFFFQLIGASIAAALISCKIRSTQELTAHMAGFTAWMYALADRVAPGLTSHQKDLIISESWKKAVELIAS